MQPHRYPTSALQVCCLCAAWCRTCEDYAAVLESVSAEFRATHPSLVVRWIDIEDESDLVGDCDITTFPTIAVIDEDQVRFFGALTPQPETLRRQLRVALAPDAPPQNVQPDVQAFAARLRSAAAESRVPRTSGGLSEPPHT